MKVGDTCYIVLNNYTVEEVIIKSISGNLYILKFASSNKAIRLPKHRLYPTKEEAISEIPEEQVNRTRTNRPPSMH